MGTKSSVITTEKNGKIMRNYNIIKKRNITMNKSNGETIIQAYERLDKEICFLESLCPGPRLATIEAWIQHLQSEINFSTSNDNISISSDGIHQVIHIKDSNDNNNNNDMKNSVLDEKLQENKEIIQLALRLGILTDENKAESEEEFFANLNRIVIKRLTRHFQKEIIVHTQSRMNHLITIYNKLSDLYAEQDGLIASINSGVYLNELEEMLDNKLEEQRNVRDKLGSVVEQWRICAFLLKTSLKFIQKAMQIWTLIENAELPVKRLSLALEFRNFILASLTTLECAKLALPQVDLKFISARQITAIEHLNAYIITDVGNKMRSSQIEKIVIAYRDNLIKAISWVFQTFETTLKKDFKESENNLNEIILNLRKLRLKIFSQISENKIYVPNVKQM